MSALATALYGRNKMEANKKENEMDTTKFNLQVWVQTACSLSAFGFIAGCAGSTEVVPSGPETYRVASHGTMGWSSEGAQKAKAFQQAADFCKSKGKQMQPIGTMETPSGFGQIASGEVEFRCVAS